MDSDDSIETEGQELVCTSADPCGSMLDYMFACDNLGLFQGCTLNLISFHLEYNMSITKNRCQSICEALQVFEPSDFSDDPDEIREFLSLRSEYCEEFYRSVSNSGGQDLLVLLPDYRAPGQPLGLESPRFHREFEVVSFLASGGFGKVFRARNKLDGTEYAVKKVKINCENLEQVPEQLAEVKTWARLKHNNVVPMNTAWLEKGKSSNRTNSCSVNVVGVEQRQVLHLVRAMSLAAYVLPPWASQDLYPLVLHPTPSLLNFLRIQNKKLRDQAKIVPFEGSSGGGGEEEEDADDDDSVDFEGSSGGGGEEEEDDDDDDSVVFEGSSGGPAVGAGDENRNQVVKREYPPGVIVNAKPHLNFKWAILFIQMPLCQQTLRDLLDERNASEDFDQFYVKFQQQRFCAEQAVSTVTRNAFCRQSSQLAGDIDPRTSDECLPTDSDAASRDGSQTEGPVHHLDVVLDVFQQLLNGLNYIHARGIVHHDIKPSNIFVSQSDHDSTITIQLGDFGLSCSRQSSHAGVGFGTQPYAAPEQLKGECDHKSDIYSLGIILLELLVPFSTVMERFEIIEEVRRGQYPPDLDSDFTALLKNMLQQQPSRRPGMLDLEEAVNRIRINRYKVKSELRQSLSLRDDETVCLRAQIDEQQRVQLESDEERLVQERRTSRTLVVKEQELIYMSLKIKNKEIELRSKEMELRTKDEEICKLKQMLRTYQEKAEGNGQSGDANGQETNGAARQ